MKYSMLRCITEIDIKQVTAGRSNEMFFDFVHEFSATNTWTDLTNTCNIKLPKNVYVKDKQGNRIPLGGNTPSKYIDNLFKGGDEVVVRFGYYVYDLQGNEEKIIAEVFRGYITTVGSKMPIELDCEDNMWLLKQTPCKPQVWPKDKTVEDLLRTLLTGTDFTVNALTETTIGDFVIQNESVAQVLERLRKDYHIESYFAGNELRIGLSVYVEPKQTDPIYKFTFQENIVSDELIYQNREDVKLSAVVNSINTNVLSSTNKRGKSKTKTERLSVLVYKLPNGELTYMEKQDGVDFPPNDEGERRTLFFPNVTSAKTLADYGIAELKKYYYSGFKGSFTTFGIPYITVGDNIVIEDKVLPDRNGKYKVKGVSYSGGVNGQRQVIELDYKLLS